MRRADENAVRPTLTDKLESVVLKQPDCLSERPRGIGCRIGEFREEFFMAAHNRIMLTRGPSLCKSTAPPVH